MKMSNDMGFALLCALSYSLPRRTYAGECVRSAIRESWDNFPRECDGPSMFRDVVCALESQNAGDDCDRSGWGEFAAWIWEKMTTKQRETATMSVAYMRPFGSKELAGLMEDNRQLPPC